MITVKITLPGSTSCVEWVGTVDAPPSSRDVAGALYHAMLGLGFHPEDVRKAFLSCSVSIERNPGPNVAS